jgi:hypothetical protein
LPSPDITEFDQFPAKPRFQVLVLRLLTMAANLVRTQKFSEKAKAPPTLIEN